MERELRPALSPGELAEADDVYDHATKRKIKLVARHPVKVHIRCNQIASDNRSICDFDVWIETVAIDATAQARKTLAEHFRSAHPAIPAPRKRGLINNIWFNLRSVGG